MSKIHRFRPRSGSVVPLEKPANNSIFSQKDASISIPSIVNPDFFLAQPSAENLRGTLASRLCDMLVAAQKWFGERDKNYTFVGFEFVNGAPRLLTQHDGKYVIIQLYWNALHDPIKAYSQTAHECIHLLSPCLGTLPNVLEEGLAYFFSNWYIRQNFGVL